MPLDLLRALRTGTTGAALMLAATLPVTATAQSDDLSALMDALKLGEVIEIMRDEGLEYGATLARDMLPGGATEVWTETVDDIYDTARMEETVRAVFVESFGDADAAPLIDYFRDGDGARFVQLENSARRAMADEDVEEAARDVARAAVSEPDARFEVIDEFVETNDLVESNVEGAMNASIRFYMGLADGGGVEMGEEDILRDVWGQEAEMRTDTGEWVYAFLLMAYQPMSDAAIEDYIALSQTPEGRALNTALFAAFDQMYGDISYALGLAVAQGMGSQEL